MTILQKSLIALIMVLVLDQLSKWVMLEIVDIDTRPTIALLPFLNVVMVWNRGISFGLFQHMENSHYVFAAVAALISVLLIVWMVKNKNLLPGIALGLIIGGAMGNIIDRLRFGAVVDFIDVYFDSYHWPAFNVADSAVCIGALLLIIDSVYDPKRKKRS